MIVVTGASGHLGRLVIRSLLEKVPAEEIVAAARTVDKVADLSVAVRHIDYSAPETIGPALEGADRVLLISSSEVGRRADHHRAVIDAAREAGVGLLAYTSILRADTSPLGLAREHAETEEAIRASGLPHVILRNGWYTENYEGTIRSAVERGAVFGSAGDGRISAASRADFAEAAAAVLTADDPAGQVHELAGDEAFTLGELAQEIAQQTGKSVEYTNLPEHDYKDALLSAGLPEPFAALIADSDTGASKGALFDDGGTLSRLIGRPTTPMATTVQQVLGR